MSSSNFFVILAVCWFTIFDGQLCTSHPQDAAYSTIKNLEGVFHQENATNQHELPKRFLECLPRDDYYDLFPIGSYKLHARAVTWADARNICREEGAHLAIINSKAEAKVLSTLLSQMGHVRNATAQDTSFLGIHDQFKEGEWVTVLDDSIYATGYTEWSDKWGGQPDNSGGDQDCGSMLKEGTLDDVSCTVKLPFICEKAYSNSCGRCYELKETEVKRRCISWYNHLSISQKRCNNTSFGSFNMSCGPLNSFFYCIVVIKEWKKSGDHWYKLNTKAECWNTARKLCAREGGYLAVVNDNAEADVLISRFHASGEAFDALCQDAVFVGIHDLFGEGDWTTIFNNPIEKVFNEWSNKWGKQPDNFGGAQNCGSLYRDGKLNDVPCSIKLPFFCEKDESP
ncbi:C-type mannose receptor 2-like [Halictus rubicundus]|uniref:C-type mannose receptor 2-like n=1 Tax=Halictus rubicundus TaxID=77578 RepID=UPI00403698C1